MNELQIFEHPTFGKIRTIIDGEKILFHAKDVATALGYSNPSKAIKDHCKGVTKRYYLSDGGKQLTNFIPEGDIYRLAAKSELPGAEKFESWIFDELLPKIRKTGFYSIRPMTDYQQRIIKTREDNARIRKAQMYAHLADKYKGASYAQVLDAYATKELSGEFLIPLPELKAKTYSAEEVGKIIGCSANMVGRIANSNGEWFKDKSKYGDKEVSSFRYYDTVLPVMKNLL